MSIAGSKVGRDRDGLYVVMHLDEFAPVGQRPASGRKRRRLERLTKIHENLTDGPWIGDECNPPDVAAAVRALQWKLRTNSSHEFCPS